MEEKNFEYDSEIDSLHIYNPECEEEAVGSITIGSLIYDVSPSGKIVGLEIDNASKLFEVDPKIFSKIENANVWIKIQGGIIFLGFTINIGEKKYNYSYIISKDKIALTC